MNPVILFRSDRDTEDELEVAKKYFDVYTCRTQVPANSLVIGRYSVLPYYTELETDLQFNGARLINNRYQHKWIAGFGWYESLKDYTFKSYDDFTFYQAPEGQYVLKGKTNSRKHQWNKMMFANNKRVAADIAAELAQDSLIGPQGIIYREYIPLKTFAHGVGGVPITNEWRFFCLDDEVVSYGYYWSNVDYEEFKIPDFIPGAAWKLAHNCMDIAKEHTRAYVLDVAEKEDGGWILVEVNDLQMSGLSLNDQDVFYKNLRWLL